VCHGGTAASLAYDNAGNLTSDGDKQYYYDVLRRLTLAESGLNSNVFGVAWPRAAWPCFEDTLDPRRR